MTVPRVAVVGVGAIGGALAAELLAAGHEVTLCSRTAFDDLVVETPHGARRLAHARVLVDPRSLQDERGPFDWVLLATKAHQTNDARGWLAALAPARVAVAQNGVEQRERVAPLCPGARIVPIVVSFPAERTAPGRVRAARAPHLTVPDDADGRAFAAAWERTGVSVDTTTDFVTAAWRKLCANVAGGAVTALTNRPLGVLQRDEVADLARGLVREAITVGIAEGADLDAGLADTIIDGMRAGRPDATPSILQDLRARRPLEYDARNGAVVRIGARHGIATPLNAAVTALLAAISESFGPEHRTN